MTMKHPLVDYTRRLAGPAAFLVTLGASSAALAANYQVCVRAQVRNSDSEQTTPTGITEDYYLTLAEKVVPARGVYISVQTGNTTLASGFTGSSTGCLEFEAPTANYIASVDVFSIARHGTTYIRAHDAGADSSSSMPGNLFVTSYANVLLAPGRRDLPAIRRNATWNAFLTGSYALWRVRTGVSNTMISMGFGSSSSSSLLGNSENYVDEGRHLVHINNGHRRRKFIVAHEIGHAVARLNYGENGTQDDFDSSYPYDGPNTNGCLNVGGYSLSSVEWDSMGFKEGYAHLYASRVFNNPVADGAFTLFGNTISLERFQPAAAGNPMGGHLRNRCDSSPDHGVSTIEDWTRFLWDMYTIPESNCGPKLGLDDMYDIYSEVRSAEPTAQDAYHTEIMNAIESLGSLSACEKEAAGDYANWNAIGGQYHSY